MYLCHVCSVPQRSLREWFFSIYGVCVCVCVGGWVGVGMHMYMCICLYVCLLCQNL